MNRHQLDVIEYLREENRVLKEHLGGRRLRLADAQRRRLAMNGHRLGRKVLRDVATLVTPDTILWWHHRLIARKSTAGDDASDDRACSTPQRVRLRHRANQCSDFS